MNKKEQMAVKIANDCVGDISTVDKLKESDVRIIQSNGRGKNGILTWYIGLPGFTQHYRKVRGFTTGELSEKASFLIKKYFTPLSIFKINGYVIYSNSAKNALREYWRFCDREDIKKIFPVQQVTSIQI